MKLHKLLFALCVSCMVSNCTTQPNSKSHLYNLDFETLDSSGNPVGWQSGFNEFYALAYPITTDSTVKHNGKYSLKMTFTGKTPSSSIAYLALPVGLEGKKITLSGYIKTDNVNSGYAGLYIKLNGENGLMGRDMMDAKRGLKGTNNWEKLSVTLPYTKEVELITVGFVLNGQGTCWVDDFSINIDGNDISEAKPRLSSPEDSLFKTNSNLKITSSTAQVDAIAALAQVWGFLKYYHPEIKKGKFNWDAELFKILPKVATEPKREVWLSQIEKWVADFKYDTTTVEKSAIDTNSLLIKPDYGDLFTPGYLSPILYNNLSDLKYKGLHNASSYYIDTTQIGVPNMMHEKLYANMAYPDAGYRLLALFRYTSFIQYFFPYLNQIEENWPSVLKKFIPIFLDAKNETEYSEACAQLITHIHDSHAQLFNENKGFHNFLGAYFPSFRPHFIEGKLIVGDFMNPSDSQSIGLVKGDIIVSINNQPIEECINKLKLVTSGSNESSILRDIARIILRGNSDSVKLKVIHAGKTEEIIIKRYKSYEHYFFSLSSPLLDNSHMIKTNANPIYYINASRLNEQTVSLLLQEKNNLSGVIIDFRNNISFDHLANLVAALKPQKGPFAIYSTCNIGLPGSFKYVYPDTYNNWGSDGQPAFTGKVVLLVNETTQSAGEHFAMAFQENPKAQTVGSTTAGADGNITIFNLPGFVTTGFSGIGVFYPDKRPTQRTGINIDIVVNPTIEGYKNNRDEQLEKAITLLNSN